MGSEAALAAASNQLAPLGIVGLSGLSLIMSRFVREVPGEKRFFDPMKTERG